MKGSVFSIDLIHFFILELCMYSLLELKMNVISMDFIFFIVVKYV